MGKIIKNSGGPLAARKQKKRGKKGKGKKGMRMFIRRAIAATQVRI